MIITIARQCGTGGTDVCNILAQHLNLQVYTREKLYSLAKERGVLNLMSGFLDEYPTNSLLCAITNHDNVEQFSATPRKILSELIGNQNCIIIGRCGNYIFGSRPDCTSIFLKGQLNDRVNFIAKAKNISVADAQEYVLKQDEQRKEYHRYYTGQEWGFAPNYDLCIDCNRIGVDNCSQIIENFINKLK